MERRSLLRELRAVLADYVDRIDRLGAESLRLRDEPFQEWDRKQGRVRLCLDLLAKAVEADDRGRLDKLLHEVARAPDAPVPPRPRSLAAVAEGSVADLRRRLAEMHREHPERCDGAHCACRGGEAGGRQGP